MTQFFEKDSEFLKKNQELKLMTKKFEFQLKQNLLAVIYIYKIGGRDSKVDEKD